MSPDATDATLGGLLRTFDKMEPKGELAERLAEGKGLRVKLGLDPTAPDVTLGWGVVLRQLRRFQERGHIAVLIVGDYTAQVGDPSDRASGRKRLTADEVRGHADRLLAGFQRILLPDPLEIRYNSEWLAGLTMAEILDMTANVTVAQMLERQDFAKRYKGQQPISLMEFMYPLLQAMDSVATDADVEIGGSDQLWNLMMGRLMMERHGKRPQAVLTLPLMVGTDGHQKMSQSLGNYISIDAPPNDMYGAVMSVPDEAMEHWFQLATEVPLDEAAALILAVSNGSMHPGAAKRRLAREIVAMWWGSEAAADAEDAFDRVFVRHDVPKDIPEVAIPEGDPVHVPALLKGAGMAASTSEARRLLDQGAVKVDGTKLAGVDVQREELSGKVLQVGKRRFARLSG